MNSLSARDTINHKWPEVALQDVWEGIHTTPVSKFHLPRRTLRMEDPKEIHGVINQKDVPRSSV